MPAVDLERSASSTRLSIAARKIQSIWRCKAARAIFQDLSCGKTASDDMDKHVCSIGRCGVHGVTQDSSGMALQVSFICFQMLPRRQTNPSILTWEVVSCLVYEILCSAYIPNNLARDFFAWRLTEIHCRAGYPNLVARDIDSPKIRFFHGCSANPNDVALCCVKSAVSNVFGGTQDSNYLAMRLVAQAVSELHSCTPYSIFGSKVYTQFRAARLIQTCGVVRTPGLRYIPARRIQTTWLCKNAHGTCKTYIASRSIQTMWRCRHLRRTFVFFAATRRMSLRGEFKPFGGTRRLVGPTSTL
jgi:hypothetical protein